VVNGNTITFEPEYRWTGQTSFQYTGTNTAGTSAPATASIAVRPVVIPWSFSANVGETLSVRVGAATDNTSTILDPSLPAQLGTAWLYEGALTYTPHANVSGTDVFRYKGTSSGGESDSADITIYLTNPIPNAVPFETSIPGNSSYNSLPISFTGGSATSVNVVNGPGAGTLNPSGSSLFYTPPSGWSGIATLQYNGTNSYGTGTSATGTIKVLPVVGGVSGSADPGVQTNLALAPQTNNTFLWLSSSPQQGQASIAYDRVYYTPNPGASGTDTFTYKAYTAGVGDSASNGTISFTIASASQPNRPPTTQVLYVSNTVTGPTNIDVSGSISDPDGDPLTIVNQTVDYANLGASVSLVGGKTLRYTPPPNYYGPDTIRYTITDGRGGLGYGQAQVLVQTQPNHAPVANNDTTQVYQNTPSTTINPLRNDTDQDGDTLTLQSIDSFYFAYGSVDGVDISWPSDIGTVTKNPDGKTFNYRSPYLTNSGTPGTSYIVVVVWYTVVDGKGGTAAAYEAIPVYAPN
jgi:hypothetical protein